MEFYPSKESILDIVDIDLQIANSFYEKNKRLEESHRKDISRVVISNILAINNQTLIEPKQFKYLAHLIVQIYPTEIAATYYIPGLKKKNPAGKLYSQYNNYRTKLNAVGLCTRKKNTNDQIEYGSLDVDNEENSEQVDSAINIVKSDEWDDSAKFYDAWNKTFNERCEYLKSGMKVIEYIQMFPFAMQPDIGYEIISLDGQRRYERLSEDIKELIINVAPLILNKLQGIKSDTQVTSMLRKYINGTPVQKAHSFRNFFSNFETEDEMQNFRSKVGYTDTFAVYTIENLHEYPRCLIILGDIKYAIDDCYKGFQTFFKMIFGLDLNYPIEALTSWVFVEHFFFKLNVTQSNNSQMETIKNELNRHIVSQNTA
ncbi:hypothetical protein PVAND_014869 [Polypedilum vanderplanki]|uniref:Uncharacterized protein n=1 Tax=Polypedilum vanderplanki TaxID=319348 RepID=A0A9J6BAZ1_POLVA|nr:hypothetical protein PVAND_014869 [Polypedilum vanderplanki]